MCICSFCAPPLLGEEIFQFEECLDPSRRVAAARLSEHQTFPSAHLDFLHSAQGGFQVRDRSPLDCAGERGTAECSLRFRALSFCLGLVAYWASLPASSLPQKARGGEVSIGVASLDFVGGGSRFAGRLYIAIGLAEQVLRAFRSLVARHVVAYGGKHCLKDSLQFCFHVRLFQPTRVFCQTAAAVSTFILHPACAPSTSATARKAAGGTRTAAFPPLLPRAPSQSAP